MVNTLQMLDAISFHNLHNLFFSFQKTKSSSGRLFLLPKGIHQYTPINSCVKGGMKKGISFESTRVERHQMSEDIALTLVNSNSSPL